MADIPVAESIDVRVLYIIYIIASKILRKVPQVTERSEQVAELSEVACGCYCLWLLQVTSLRSATRELHLINHVRI